MSADNSPFAVEGEYNPLGMLPKCAGLPVIVGMIWTRIGGSFTYAQPESGTVQMLGKMCPAVYDPLPQIADEPHLQFQSASELQGAHRLIETLVRYMDPEDRDALWTLFAMGGGK